MKRTTIGNGIGLLVLMALTACASGGTPEQSADGDVHCRPTETKTCDRFAGENYNCSCQRGDRLRDILDANSMQ